MVMNIEKQRQVTSSFTEGMDVAALTTSFASQKSIGIGRSKFRKESFKKEEKFCMYCEENGHTKDTCFKLHGYPDWYKELRQKKKGPAAYKTKINMADTPLDNEKLGSNHEKQEGSMMRMSLREIIQEELSKMLKGKSTAYHNFVGYIHKNLQV